MQARREQAADLALAAGDQNAAAALLYDLVAHASLEAGEIARLARKVPINALPEYASVQELTQSLQSILASGRLTPAQRAEANWQLGRVLADAGDWEAAAPRLKRAIPGLAHRPGERALAMTWLGRPFYGMRPARVHKHWLDRAVAAAADPAIPSSDRWNILAERATALLIMGDDEGWEVYDELPQDAGSPQQALRLAIGWLNSGDLAMHWGRYGRAGNR